MRTRLLVAGLVRDGDRLLLVRQHGPAGRRDVWALPGGRVEPDELAIEAVLREVHEETGLVAYGTPVLRCVGQLANPTDRRLDDGEVPGPGEVAVALTYEVTVRQGPSDHTGDPDADIVGLEWCRWQRAEQLLSQHPFRFNREVYRTALGTARIGGAAVGQCYLRRTPAGVDELWDEA